VPWIQPWGTASAKAPLAMPTNAATGRGYSGINILILWGAVIEHGFPAQSWLTFRQALSLGGNVCKGERGTTVVYADRFVPEDEKRRVRETGDDPQAIPFLKRFTGFSAAQCENLPEAIAIAAPPAPPGLIEPTVDALIAATGIEFRIGGNRAYYDPAHDHVQVGEGNSDATVRPCPLGFPPLERRLSVIQTRQLLLAARHNLCRDGPALSP
jgi:antirestriction protein ArdC